MWNQYPMLDPREPVPVVSENARFLIISETSTDAAITVVLNWRAAASN
jgi:hypothetical protein